MENEELDLDTKPAGNKDLWLFLITVDIVFLCIFGFFLYKHFAGRIFQAPVTGQTVTAEEAVVTEPEEVFVEQTVTTVEQLPAAEEPIPAATVQAEEVPLSAVLAAAAKPDTEPQAKPEEKPQTAAAPVVSSTEQSAQPAEQKESIVVAGNPKSKYRKVTFRWFGEGKKVQIVSGFTMSKPQALKKKGDYWETTLSIAPGTYKFLYIIDGENRRDPYSPEKDGRSVVEIK